MGWFRARALVGRASTWTAAALLTLVVVLSAPRAAGAQSSLEGDEAERLSRGETLVFDQVLDRNGHRYVGGTTYTVIDASMPELESLFVDMSAYRQLLPRTKQARLIGVNDGDFFVELRQGNSLVETSYTIRVRRETLPPREDLAAPTASGDQRTAYRFWLDRTKPHGIEDAWGYFRLEPLANAPNGAPRVLLTYGILVDVGPGLVRDLFEEPLRQLALTVPQRVRTYALAHFRLGGRA
jgi:hypothetical protein